MFYFIYLESISSCFCLLFYKKLHLPNKATAEGLGIQLKRKPGAVGRTAHGSFFLGAAHPDRIPRLCLLSPRPSLALFITPTARHLQIIPSSLQSRLPPLPAPNLPLQLSDHPSPSFDHVGLLRKVQGYDPSPSSPFPTHLVSFVSFARF
jgi:hypothetical protein